MVVEIGWYLSVKKVFGQVGLERSWRAKAEISSCHLHFEFLLGVVKAQLGPCMLEKLEKSVGGGKGLRFTAG